MRRVPLFQLFAKANSVFLPHKNTKKFRRLEKMRRARQNLGTRYKNPETQHNKILENIRAFTAVYGDLNLKFFKNLAQKVGKARYLIRLESRADVILFRSSFFPTLWAARQWISHGHVQVNNKPLKTASFQLRPGDFLSFSKRPQPSKIFYEKPYHLEIDFASARVLYLFPPQRIHYAAKFDFDIVWKGLIV